MQRGRYRDLPEAMTEATTLVQREKVLVICHKLAGSPMSLKLSQPLMIYSSAKVKWFRPQV